ncbi:MAG: hypothetical protein GEV07_03810 [Streptosporangiales bacterium]|nr:hypothetical protein [Streptosporangiales bacterium]
MHADLLAWEKEREEAGHGPGSRYWIEGEHWGPRPDADGTLFLRWDLESGNYVMGEVKGGREDVKHRTASQDAASQAFYRMVTEEPAVAARDDAATRRGSDRHPDRAQAQLRDRDRGDGSRAGGHAPGLT